MRTRPLSLFAFVALASAAACSNSSTTSLVRTDPVAAGGECPAGGVSLRTGVDRNSDGILEDSEVASTSYVCNGGSGSGTAATPATLVRVVPEPAGGHCRDGGSAVEAGLDTNGNGALDDGEVTTTSYVCTGASGVLVRVAAEPSGAHCLRGGSAISSGADANHDGILEDNEITSTSFVCNPVPTAIAGDVVIAVAADVAQLTGVPRVDGNVIVRAPDLKELVLPDLVTIGGDLKVTRDAKALTIVRLPRLITVGGAVNLLVDGWDGTFTELTLPALRQAAEFVVSGGKMTTLSLEALTTVVGTFTITQTSLAAMPTLRGLNHVGSFEISFNNSLPTVQLPQNLRSIDGDLAITANSKATGVYLPACDVRGGVRVNLNDALVGLGLGGATVAGVVDIEQNKALTSIDSPVSAGTITVKNNAALSVLVLRMVAGNIYGINVFYNPALTQILDYGAIRYVQTLDIESNPLLTGLSLPLLQSAGQISVRNNSKLPQCLRAKLDAQLLQPAFEDWSDNDTTATCN